MTNPTDRLCKNCKKAKASGSLRPNSTSKDPRGFELMKRYHLGCSPTQSHLLTAVEAITVFSYLKGLRDQDALRKLEAAVSPSQTATEVSKRDGNAVKSMRKRIQ